MMSSFFSSFPALYFPEAEFSAGVLEPTVDSANTALDTPAAAAIVKLPTITSLLDTMRVAPR
ncbi:hypothetical protein D3C81_2112640 [compost metagenome]